MKIETSPDVGTAFDGEREREWESESEWDENERNGPGDGSKHGSFKKSVEKKRIFYPDPMWLRHTSCAWWQAGEQVDDDISRRLATVDRMIDCPGPAGRLGSFKPQINVTERAGELGPPARVIFNDKYYRRPLSSVSLPSRSPHAILSVSPPPPPPIYASFFYFSRFSFRLLLRCWAKIITATVCSFSRPITLANNSRNSWLVTQQVPKQTSTLNRVNK